MAGRTNLQSVLESMKVSCDGVEYGFATIEKGTSIDTAEVLGTFQEQEGMTLIAGADYLAGKDIASEGPFAKLTIEVHTSLELIGLTAVLAAKLAEAEISANMVAAYYHDHVFVQHDLRDKAVAVFNSLKGGAKL